MSTVSVRLDHFSELTDSSGTANASIDASSAKAPVGELDMAADETNGRYFVDRREGVNSGSVHEVLVLAATGAENATCKCAVWGWAQLGEVWAPFKLLEVTGTLGTRTGVSGLNPDNTWRFPDAIAVNANNCPDGTCEAFGGTSGDNGIVALRFDGGQFPVLEVELADNASATAVRCWRAKQ